MPMLRETVTVININLIFLFQLSAVALPIALPITISVKIIFIFIRISVSAAALPIAVSITVSVTIIYILLSPSLILLKIFLTALCGWAVSISPLLQQKGRYCMRKSVVNETGNDGQVGKSNAPLSVTVAAA
jgi:hypothetical protein